MTRQTTRQPTMPTLPPVQIVALERYARDYEKAQRQNASRIEAAQALQAVKARLTPQQFAVVDLAAGRGLTIQELATKTGRKAADLGVLLSQAAHRLAMHYEATGDAA